jgi:arylsulfatase A-like enzyme
VIRALQPLSPGTYPTVDWDEGLWRQYIWAYYRLIEKVDAQIGQILNALKETGQDGNTVIVFSSDHGDGTASHRWNQKTLFYDEIARVPCIVRPPLCPGGGTADRHNLVSMNLDFFPTVFDYAELPVPDDLAGRSLRPLLDRRPGASGHDFVVSQNDLAPDYGVSGGVFGRMLRNDRFKYARYSTGENREQFFDLENDPGERHNLADDPEHAANLNYCRDLLDTWMRVKGDPFPGLET